VRRRRQSKTLTAPSQPERMPHTRANFGIENPQHNNSSGSDEERQGTGDDEEAGSAGSNCGQDVSNATGGSSGKKSATDKAVSFIESCPCGDQSQAVQSSLLSSVR
jgi:hypothetical protein